MLLVRAEMGRQEIAGPAKFSLSMCILRSLWEAGTPMLTQPIPGMLLSCLGCFVIMIANFTFDHTDEIDYMSANLTRDQYYKAFNCNFNCGRFCSRRRRRTALQL